MNQFFQQKQIPHHIIVPSASVLLVILLSCVVTNLYAQSLPPASLSDTAHLADLSVQELINLPVKVTSVSKKPQSVVEAAAAVFVITPEDIRRSGATSLAEILRLAPGLNVSRVNSNTWFINARGSTGKFANKLLVLIDGRSVYFPVFGNVDWTSQDTLLEDIDRIEVVRGPGATLWGSNAVNGVINIITKKASKTQGGLAVIGGGTKERNFDSLRYGDKAGESGYYRAYAKYFNRDNFANADGGPANDAWHAVQGGFRYDSQPSANDSFTFQGDTYYNVWRGDLFVPTLTPPFTAIFPSPPNGFPYSGANLLGRWTRTLSSTSDFQLQLYYDYVSRDDGVLDSLYHVYDVDILHRFQPIKRHEILWGAGYRLYTDTITGTPSLSFDPESRDIGLVTWFGQDEIRIIGDELRLVLGSKFEATQFTGLEVQPNARLLFVPTDQHTFWAAISRAVRTPARTEHDASLQAQVFPGENGNPFPTLVVFQGNKDYDSENLIAYEVGYRTQPKRNISFDLAFFFNDYSRLFTLEPEDPVVVEGEMPFVMLPFAAQNRASGNSYGVELVSDWKPIDWWRLVLSYSFIKTKIFLDSTSQDPGQVKSIEGETPENQVLLRSLLTLPSNWEFDSVLRFTDRVPSYSINSYFDLDLRLGKKLSHSLEASLVGQNLLHEKKVQISSPLLVPYQSVAIERGVYAKLTWRF